ncbi:hypothetical protein Bca52824_001321 [Brassica carinata]|uniref:Uncharacterized protein n=1 Tax=Brassica carinata TaxID=52824 RepID=A0A8X7WIB2_BRACI|nr:hypothetical protein Bca52824_001321 [Brassica carinata]
MKRSIRLINEAHADMNPAAPCNPFGGLTRLKEAERKLADIQFLVDKEVEELALRIDTMQQRLRSSNANSIIRLHRLHRSMSSTSHRSIGD